MKATVDLSQFTRTMDSLAIGLADFGIPMRVAADEYRLLHGQEWDEVKFSSGTVMFRSEAAWPAAADQYTRSDGTVVPAWGGVPKVRGRGNVKGKKRPSGAPVKADEVMMVDTAHMRNEFLANPKYEENGNRVIFETTAEYAGVQNARRPFAFFAAVDVENFRNNCARYVQALMARLRSR
jgi:hypothetical protein